MNMTDFSRSQSPTQAFDLTEAWKKIASFWPLKNLIAVNPLSGFEGYPFEEALAEGARYFRQADLPAPLLIINRHTIKWMQVYFDEGQATFPMPGRDLGLLKSVKRLMRHDRSLLPGKGAENDWFSLLDDDADSVIAECMLYLGISRAEHESFITLMLSTLSGWSSYVKYRADEAPDSGYSHLKEDYLALRLIITCLVWPEARSLLQYVKETADVQRDTSENEIICKAEEVYAGQLISTLGRQAVNAAQERPEAQMVFCIDVRSEPFRRALEGQGLYETFGFAGFFGLPISIRNELTGESHASCPVLLKPQLEVCETLDPTEEKAREHYQRSTAIKRFYQSLKYSFATPFALVETMGPLSGLLMGLRNFSPKLFDRLVGEQPESANFLPDLKAISFEKQVEFAFGALTGMGLTKSFAALVVFCGHGSHTENNAYATSLDCGACGGHHGAPNARILAAILNQQAVREALGEKGIHISKETHFVGAQHNTTTDQVKIYECEIPLSHRGRIKELKEALSRAAECNTQRRLRQLGEKEQVSDSVAAAQHRSTDWSQVRPEWGLAGNAAFIIGPRALTKHVDLEGRAFLHSYDHQQDPEGAVLAGIMTAPLVVAQWINGQYLFSSLDNVAFGGGSKISKNITGKVGIMQGNASDLMTGLPLQSVYESDSQPYHIPQRLLAVIYAKRSVVSTVVSQHDILKRLFGNGWVHVCCVEPESRQTFRMTRALDWEKVSSH